MLLSQLKGVTTITNLPLFCGFPGLLLPEKRYQVIQFLNEHFII